MSEPRRALSVEQLKSERDRFVAFAFSAADMLLELDGEHRVVFSAGATSALIGRSSKQLLGYSLYELIATEDRPFVRRLLSKEQSEARIEPVTVQFIGKDGRRRRFLLAGYKMPELGERYFLSLSLSRSAATLQQAQTATRDEESGLVDKDSFVALAGEAVKAAEQNEDANLTLISLGDFEAFRERVSDEVGQELAREIGAHLRAGSVDGVTAGRLSHDKFAIVHKASMDAQALAADIRQTTARLDPEGSGIEVASNSVELNEDALGEDDMVRAITYTINEFTKTPHGEFKAAGLKENYDSMLRVAVGRISEFRDIVARGDFWIAYQPIVALKNRVCHHFEALVRFKNNGSPFDTINFAEDVGVISEFDLAMCERVIRVVEERLDGGSAVSLAVNLSARSLASQAFIDALRGLLRAHPTVRHNLVFEITESSEIHDLKVVNAIVQQFRADGHEVCLDDFGAGAAAFQYLRGLQVDFVKIDGQYVRDALKDSQTRAFLNAISHLCADLGIDTIAEFIEDEKTARFLIESGVKYGQGYYFGKPSAELPDMNTGGLKKRDTESGYPVYAGQVRRGRRRKPNWG